MQYLHLARDIGESHDLLCNASEENDSIWAMQLWCDLCMTSSINDTFFKNVKPRGELKQGWEEKGDDAVSRDGM